MEACVPYGWEWFVIVLFLLPVLATYFIIKAVLYCIIFHKAGFHWAFGLVALVPVVRIALPLILTLFDWPIQKELRLLKQKS